MLTFRQVLDILDHMIQYIEHLKELRTSKGLSQEVVAQAIGVSRPTYSAIEAGTQELSLEEGKKLAALFSIGIDELLSGSIPDIKKYKHMILAYLRMNISHDGKIPKTKLAKMLYLADFAWFYEHMESMSGMPYRKIAYGPVPDTFFRVLDELEEAGKIVVDRKSSEGKDMLLIQESESNKNEKIRTLSKDEISLMQKIAKKWKDKKTNDIVNFTHNQLPYVLCRDNELIPYELITQEDAEMVY
jgi:transcriptional regulator with XRE-family HTH domain